MPSSALLAFQDARSFHSLRLNNRTLVPDPDTCVSNRHARSPPIHNQNKDHKQHSLEWCSPEYANSHPGAVNPHRSMWYGQQSHQAETLCLCITCCPCNVAMRFKPNMSNTYTSESSASYWLNNWLPNAAHALIAPASLMPSCSM